MYQMIGWIAGYMEGDVSVKGVRKAGDDVVPPEIRSLDEATQIIDVWRDHYNNQRPHSTLNYITPAAYAKRAA